MQNKSSTGAYFRFRKNDNIGEAEAESDDEFLSKCFVDNGDIGTLLDCKASQRILVGRTGAGKSALIKMVQSRGDHVISVPPEQLALSHLSNSSVIKFFEEAGANLDVFYQLLWRHVLVVELLKHKYKINNEQSQRSFLQVLSQLVNPDKAKQQAVEYLRKWGENFWNETEYRVKEVTSKLESDLKSSLTTPALLGKLEAGASSKLSEEEKAEIVQRGAHVVSQVQIKALADVLKLLREEIFNDSQERYYITIDDLDTKWATDSIKFKLIRALIETVKNFRQIETVKIIVSLRLDLLQRVVDATKDSGFQSEKYESLFLRLKWNKADIVNIVDARLAQLVKQRYTTRAIGLRELFPQSVGRVNFEDFLVQRTFLRPRDAILFINECIVRAADRGQINSQIILDAEDSYSQKRLDSLTEEWVGIYPLVAKYLSIFSQRKESFKLSDLTAKEFEEWVYANILNHEDSRDPVYSIAQKFYLEEKSDEFSVRRELVKCLYAVGAAGVKTGPTAPWVWSYYSDHRLVESSLHGDTAITLHPLFWKAIGVRNH